MPTALRRLAVERYTLTSPADERKLAKYPYAVCFTDGAASTAVSVRQGESGPQVSEEKVILVWGARATTT